MGAADSDSTCARAEQLLQQGRPELALHLLDRVRGPAAFTGAAMLLRARALLALGRAEDAAAAATRGLAGMVRSTGGRLTLGAEVRCARDLWWVLADSRWARLDLDGAHAAQRSALALDPEHAGLLCDAARALVVLGRVGEAERALDRAERSDPAAPGLAAARRFVTEQAQRLDRGSAAPDGAARASASALPALRALVRRRGRT